MSALATLKLSAAKQRISASAPRKIKSFQFFYHFNFFA